MMMTVTNSIAAAAVGAWAFAIKSTVFAVVTMTSPLPVEGFASYGDPVRPGEDIIISWQIIKRVDCIGSARRVWRGEDGFVFNDPIVGTTINKSDDWKEYKVSTKVPLSAPAGFLRLTVEGVYDCPAERYTFALGPVVLTVVENEG